MSSLDKFVLNPISGLFANMLKLLNSLRPSGAYMCQQPRTSLVQIMACRLFGATPLTEPMLEYCLNRNLNIFID